MPLLRRKPFALTEPPQDLKPDEHVYQVRFTKEIFRDYQDYLNRLNLYRQRVWACKATGKTGLTYEEALVSEQRATEKFLQFPKEFTTPALRIIQYSMLPLKELADSIAEKLHERLFAGAELYAKKDDGVCPCKILKVIQEGVDRYRYEVAWLDKNKNISEKTEVNAEDLVQKKPLFSRNILKSFIRESTYRNAPWVLHDKLAQKHGISTDVPAELRGRVFLKDGLIVCSKKRNNERKIIRFFDVAHPSDLNNDQDRVLNKTVARSKRITSGCHHGNKHPGEKKIRESMEEADKHKRKKLDGTLVNGSSEGKENGEYKDIPVKYPIDDLLVKPSPDDPVFTDRPSLSRDFNVPMHCVGDLLMVWDFCTSFGKQLNLWPYSLEDFENAICNKDSNVLLVESHAALFRVLIDDDGEYSSAIENRKLQKITMVNWNRYLCDFLEMINIPQLRHYEATIRRGHYGPVDANAKLEILRELVNQVLETAIFREKLDVLIEQRQELGAANREEALEDGRKKRERERLKAGPESNAHQIPATNDHNGHGEIESSQDNSLDRSGIKHSSHASKKTLKNLDSELKEPAENGKELSHKELKKRSKQRREYFEREIEKRIINRSPLGKDRDYNRYWWFRRDGRIFVESCESKEWGYYSSKEELDALMGSLNCKGERERALKNHLEKKYSSICSELQKRSKDLMQNIANDESALRRSTRVRAPPRENPANAFLKYVNKWKEE